MVSSVGKIRVTLAWFVAGLFTILSVGGEGLHLLPGCGHHACCQHRGCASSKHEHQHEHEHESCALVASFRQAADAESCESVCPVCEFLAVAKCLLVAEAIASSTGHVTEYVATSGPLVLRTFVSAYRCRAPPFQTAIS